MPTSLIGGTDPSASAGKKAGEGQLVGFKPVASHACHGPNAPEFSLASRWAPHGSIKQQIRDEHWMKHPACSSLRTCQCAH